MGTALLYILAIVMFAQGVYWIGVLALAYGICLSVLQAYIYMKERRKS